PSAQGHRQLVPDDRTADRGIETALLEWRFGWSEGNLRVELVVREVEVEISVVYAGSGSRDDLDAAETDTAEFGTVRVIVDSDFLYLLFRWQRSTTESIDKETAARVGVAAGAGNLL